MLKRWIHGRKKVRDSGSGMGWRGVCVCLCGPLVSEEVRGLGTLVALAELDVLLNYGGLGPP